MFLDYNKKKAGIIIYTRKTCSHTHNNGRVHAIFPFTARFQLFHTLLTIPSSPIHGQCCALTSSHLHAMIEKHRKCDCSHIYLCQSHGDGGSKRHVVFGLQNNLPNMCHGAMVRSVLMVFMIIQGLTLTCVQILCYRWVRLMNTFRWCMVLGR